MSEQSDRLRSRFHSNESGFHPYITSIRFPAYKSLEPDLTISFDHPITALVGPNGSNKSSILHALNSAPGGRSLAQFWFSTEVDDIDKNSPSAQKHRFIYSYKFDNSNTEAEVRVARERRWFSSPRYNSIPAPLKGKRDPDYWETTKWVKSDNMTPIPKEGYDDRVSVDKDGKRTRWTPVNKPVEHLDFRAELSAFDKFIHHQPFDRWTKDQTQKRLRAILRARPLAKALSGKALSKKDQNKLSSPPKKLDAKTVEHIAKILGKPIAEVTLLKHSFYGPPGYTAVMTLERNSGSASEVSYSEAHAGSGEFAIAVLVARVMQAEARSLILLDEPEVSLHPGAQTALMEFLNEQSLKHGHQVVMSTHSPTLIAELPPSAIKLLGYSTKDQKVVLLSNSCAPTEAFFHLGHRTAAPELPTIVVEDELAQELVQSSLRRLAPSRLASIDVRPVPGGAESIVKHLASTFAITDSKKVFLLLDGDKNPKTHPPTKKQCSHIDTAVKQSPAAMQHQLKYWFETFICTTAPYLHSNTDKATDPEVLSQTINWAENHLTHLPGSTPEELLARAAWPNEFTKQNSPTSPKEWKALWRDKTAEKFHLTSDEPVTSERIFSYQREVIANLPKDCTILQDIYGTVDQLVTIKPLPPTSN